MLIGIDFDNTLISYDAVFHSAAVARGLIATEIPKTKNSVRGFLIESGHEDEWTELQGYVYGKMLDQAEVFPGVMEFLSWCVEKDISCRIVSHKTRRPYKGPQYDLHRAAQEWLELRGFYDGRKTGFEPDHVYFESTKREKLERISLTNCTHFIDDLPEILGDEAFPTGVRGILFDPSDGHLECAQFTRAKSWQDIILILSNEG